MAYDALIDTIAKTGGVSSLARKLTAAGYLCSRQRIYRWLAKGQVPDTSLNAFSKIEEDPGKLRPDLAEAFKR